MSSQISKTGWELERRVADIYRAMGARKVEHDVELAGHQIDVYVEIETADRALHRIAVEAKDYTNPVGIEIVREFADIVDTLRRLGEIDQGVIVSAAGFSRPARNAARTHRIRLLEMADLKVMAASSKVQAQAEQEQSTEVFQAEPGELEEVPEWREYRREVQRVFPPMPYCFKVGVCGCPHNIAPNPRRVFVGLPPDIHDPFKYGILPALDVFGLSAWLLDRRIGYVDRLCLACQGIQGSRYALLDGSNCDANVLFYLGLAYGLGREVVLIRQRLSEIPQALVGMEFLEYSHADDLREKLVQFFQSKLKR